MIQHEVVTFFCARDSSVSVIEYKIDSDWYRQELLLRDRVLRSPLGMVLSAADTEKDGHQFHFGWIEGSRLLGCVLFLPQSYEQLKLRQMAMAPEVQGRGLGKALVLASEMILADRGYAHVELHARQTAVGFYEQLGYVIEGAAFMEIGLPHHRMIKVLERHGEHNGI